MRMWMAAVTLMLAAGSPLMAGSLDETRVGADAKWIAHLDFDALRASATVRMFAKPWLATDRVQRELAKIRDTIGLDPTEDLHSATHWGSEPKDGRGVLLIAAEVDRQRLEAFLAKQPDYATDTYEGHAIHRWTHHHGRRGDVTVHGCFPAAGLLVFGRDPGDLKAAVDVLDGRGANLAAADSSLTGPAPVGTVLDLRATGLAEADLPLKSPILRLSKLLRVAVGEHEGTAFVEARLVAKSEEHAPPMRDVMVGAVAFAKLYCNDNEEALNILDVIDVTLQGPTVTLSWQGKAADVVRVIGRQIIKHRGGDR